MYVFSRSFFYCPPANVGVGVRFFAIKGGFLSSASSVPKAFSLQADLASSKMNSALEAVLTWLKEPNVFCSSSGKVACLIAHFHHRGALQLRVVADFDGIFSSRYDGVRLLPQSWAVLQRSPLIDSVYRRYCGELEDQYNNIISAATSLPMAQTRAFENWHRKRASCLYRAKLHQDSIHDIIMQSFCSHQSKYKNMCCSGSLLFLLVQGNS